MNGLRNIVHKSNSVDKIFHFRLDNSEHVQIRFLASLRVSELEMCRDEGSDAQAHRAWNIAFTLIMARKKREVRVFLVVLWKSLWRSSSVDKVFSFQMGNLVKRVRATLSEISFHRDILFFVRMASLPFG